jgi:hypothetical protein
LQFHFSETVEALVERGWPETVARAEAERRFGSRERYRRRLEKIRRQGGQRRSRMKDVMSPVMRLFRRDALYGLAIGLVLAAIASRLLTTLLYGFRPDYIVTVAAVSLILGAVATLACFVPARRASLIDPIIALRQE